MAIDHEQLWDMDFDHPYIQFAFNVVAITAITALWLMRALVPRGEEESISKATGPLNHRVRQPNANVPHAVSARHAEAVDPNPAARQDIREFVSHRAEGWLARSASARVVRS